LSGGKAWVTGLSDCSGEDIEATDVVGLAGDFAKLFVESMRIAAGELGNPVNAEQMKIAEHGRADGDKRIETARPR
jgi:hypothetical protein